MGRIMCPGVYKSFFELLLFMGAEFMSNKQFTNQKHSRFT